MTPEQVGKIIAERIAVLEKKGISLREIERKTRVSRRTLVRYTEGFFPRETGNAERVVRYIFPSLQKQSKVMDLIETCSSASEERVSINKQMRNEMTKASRKVECKIEKVLITEYGPEGRDAVDQIKKKKGKFEVSDLHDIEKRYDLGTRLKEVEISVVFMPKQSKKDSNPLPLLSISSRKGIEYVFDHDLNDLRALDKLDEKERIHACLQLCRHLNINIKGLLELARKVLFNDPMFDEKNRLKKEDMRIPTWLFSRWESLLNECISYERQGFVVRKGSGYKYSKSDRRGISNRVVNIMNGMLADFKYFENEYRELKNGQAKLWMELNKIYNHLFPTKS